MSTITAKQLYDWRIVPAFDLAPPLRPQCSFSHRCGLGLPFDIAAKILHQNALRLLGL
jgi:hypothetical protein